MSVETKLPHSNQPMSLSKMLLVPSNGGTLTATSPVSVSTNTVVIDTSPEVAGRDILFRAMLKDDEPVMIPQEYLTECIDADASVPALAAAVTGAGSRRAYDAVLDRHFVVTPNTSPPVDSTTRHANLQRVYGYSDSDRNYLVLEDFSKGTLATFLKTAKGRVQLNAQRRITIMLNVAQVLNLQKQFAISSYNIGIDNNLNPKVMRHAAATDNNSGGDNEMEAFGILMMELLTGSLQNDGSDDRRLGDFVQRYTIKGHLIEDDLDPYVRESWTFNILSQLVELALNCVHPEQQKPTPQTLVETLSLISSRMRVVDNYDYY